ncbi:MAG: DMP19 family protein [Limisphaerales bacterium]
MKNIIIFSIVAVGLIVVFAVPRWKQAQRAKKFDAYFEKQYGALGKSTEEILGHENATNAFTVVGALRYRIGQKPESRLTDTERRLLAAYWVEAEANNGGFDQYFFNSAGDNAEVALVGLKDMGAAGPAGLLERAMAVFPGGKPPADRFKRQEVMQQISTQSKPVWEKCDSEFYKLTERISDLSLAYAKKKRAEIVLP